MDVLFISVFNYGGLSIALNHLTSLKKQDITNYMAYVTDQEAHDAVSERGFNVTLIDENHGKEAWDFDSKRFNAFSYIRYKIIHNLLLEGKKVWYMDTDTVVLNDIRELYYRLEASGVDAAFQNDVNMLCTGCMFFFPNEKTIHFTNSIYGKRCDNFGDQIITNRFLNENPAYFRIYAFDIEAFPNGLVYFDKLVQISEYKQVQSELVQKCRQYRGDTYFVHANWMIGLKTKMDAFKSKNLWFIDE
jgi:lipopolysaccharide biosynthesis glycosyltransferase